MDCVTSMQLHYQSNSNLEIKRALFDAKCILNKCVVTRSLAKVYIMEIKTHDGTRTCHTRDTMNITTHAYS